MYKVDGLPQISSAPNQWVNPPSTTRLQALKEAQPVLLPVFTTAQLNSAGGVIAKPRQYAMHGGGNDYL